MSERRDKDHFLKVSPVFLKVKESEGHQGDFLTELIEAGILPKDATEEDSKAEYRAWRQSYSGITGKRAPILKSRGRSGRSAEDRDAMLKALDKMGFDIPSE